MKLIIALLLVLRTVAFAQPGWFSQTNGTTGDLSSVHFVNKDTGFVVGAQGTILKTTNGGTSWVGQSVGAAMRSVAFMGPDTGWAVGDAIVKTTNSGTSWFTQATFPNALFSVSFANTNVGWAVGTYGDGSVRKTTNNGITWASQTIEPYYLYSVHAVDPNTAWVVGGSIFRTTNGGSSWIRQSRPTGSGVYLYAVYFINSNMGWAVGERSDMLKTTDAGSTWAIQGTPMQNHLYSVFFVDSLVGWAVGSGGLIRGTTNGGSTWQRQTSGTTSDLQSVYFINATVGWAVGSGGTILKTTTGGIIMGREEETKMQVPWRFTLQQNYPNPFNPSTEIKFSVETLGRTTLEVFNIIGQRVATLFDDVAKAGQYYKVKFEARNLASGIYLYRLVSGKQSTLKKFLLLK